jgi:hypothetical protein
MIQGGHDALDQPRGRLGQGLERAHGQAVRQLAAPDLDWRPRLEARIGLEANPALDAVGCAQHIPCLAALRLEVIGHVDGNLAVQRAVLDIETVPVGIVPTPGNHHRGGRQGRNQGETGRHQAQAGLHEHGGHLRTRERTYAGRLGTPCARAGHTVRANIDAERLTELSQSTMRARTPENRLKNCTDRAEPHLRSRWPIRTVQGLHRTPGCATAPPTARCGSRR